MYRSIDLEKTLGDDIEDFYEDIVIPNPSNGAGVYSFQAKLLTATDLQNVESEDQEYFKTFSKVGFHILFSSNRQKVQHFFENLTKRDLLKGLQNYSNSKGKKYEFSICNRKTFSIK